jgi:hypothetical protein
MKNQLTSYLRVWAMVVFCATMLVIAMGVGRQRQGRIAAMGGAQEDRFLFSATEIIRLSGGTAAFDSDIARLDTRTGAVYRFRGDVDVASVQNTWELRVPPVKEKTSGMLELQNILPHRPIRQGDVVMPFETFFVDTLTGETVKKVETSNSQVKRVTASAQVTDIVRPVTFLVDIVEGTTWILRETTGTNARWQLIDIFRSAQFK